MKIVSLEPYLTDLVISLGFEKSLLGITHLCSGLPEGMSPLVVSNAGKASLVKEYSLLSQYLSWHALELEKIKLLSPDVLLTRIQDPNQTPGMLKALREQLEKLVGHSVKLYSFAPERLDQVYDMYAGVGQALGVASKGREFSLRIEAQFKNWADNFYERMKNKSVSIIGSIEPLQLAGYWVPEMARLLSTHPQGQNFGQEPVSIEWADLIKFRPDVILVAPQGLTVKQSMQSFKIFEKLPGWDDIPAVKRGEVIFTDGVEHFYKPTGAFIESMAILVSALAGFESGYITPRDMFYRLRWLEMNRHKI